MKRSYVELVVLAFQFALSAKDKERLAFYKQYAATHRELTACVADTNIRNMSGEIDGAVRKCADMIGILAFEAEFDRIMRLSPCASLNSYYSLDNFLSITRNYVNPDTPHLLELLERSNKVYGEYLDGLIDKIELVTQFVSIAIDMIED